MTTCKMILLDYFSQPILIVHEQYQPIHMFNLHILNPLIKVHCTYHVAINFELVGGKYMYSK